MTAASYVPGTWLGVVRSRTAVLLGPGTPPELAGAVWDLLAGRPAVHEVLAAVTSSSGGSLAQIPPFGILDFDGPLRVFLRGGLELTVDSPDGPVELDGRDVTTWNERRFAVPSGCRLVIADAGVPGQPVLPLSEGVVLLQALALSAAAGPAAVGAAPAGVAVPAASPAPEETVLPGVPETAEFFDGGAPLTGAAGAGAGPDGGSAPAPAAAVPEEDLPEITLLPEHGVSAETVVGVPDDDMDFGGEAHVGPVEADAAAGQEGQEDGSPDQAAAAAPSEERAADQTGGVQAPAEPASGPYTVGTSAPVNEQTTSYDHLWDRTVMRNIEDAAVREDPEADAAEGSGQAVALPASGPSPALEPAQGGQLDGTASGNRAGDPGAETDASQAGGGNPGSPQAEDAPGRAAPRPAAGVLIDSVPWRTGGSSGPAPSPSPATPALPTPPTLPTPPVPVAPAGVPTDSSAAAPDRSAAAPDPRPGTEPGAGLDFDPDHDGQTVMKGSLAGLPGPQLPAAARVSDDAAGPLVLARVCAQGHPNPPTAAQCTCGAALLPDAVQVPRPRLGRMRLSTGELLDLDQSMVIGRQPSVSRVQGGVMPKLVQVASPGGDISRSHVEVRLEGWHVMLCDLKATNGTVLVREGQPPRRLAQNEMAILLDGDIAELGDNISLRFEEIP